MFEPADEDAIVNALHALNVRYFRPVPNVRSEPMPPALLLASMCASMNARLEMALVVLFLEHPEFSDHVEPAAALLNSHARSEALRLYYQAAVYLQHEFGARGKAMLRDMYSERFASPAPVANADVAKTDAALEVLAERHRQLNLPYASVTNWRNTYRKQLALHEFKLMSAAT